MSNALATIDQEPELTADNWLDNLDNQERAFVIAYVVSLDVKNSALKAGYALTVAMSHAYGWISKTKCTKPHVKRAVEYELRRRSSEELVTREMVIRRLRSIAFADPRNIAKWRSQKIVDADEMEPGDDGVVRVREIVSNTVELYDSDALDDETAAAIKSIKQDRDGNVHIELHPSVPALMALGKHLGIMDDRVRHLGPDGGPVVVITADMRAKEAADAYRTMLEGD